MSVKTGVECWVLQLQPLDVSVGLSDQICLENMFMCLYETTFPLDVYIYNLPNHLYTLQEIQIVGPLYGETSY